jgi:hypothetical protein
VVFPDEEAEEEMATEENATAEYPNTLLRLNVLTISDTTANPGRTMM